MGKKRVTEAERVRQFATLPALLAAKAEVEARAYAKADHPRQVSLKSFAEFQRVVNWARVFDAMAEARGLPCFSEGGHYRSGRARKDFDLVAVRVWGFR
ncbi:hypothetical protein AB0O87_10595 [Microbacterium sp. NPDC076768]|uniref:hypothetical protein n=1 Tax=Microbacterium sp. NPDC076768 TaxID=3154858 RepID=UPI00342A228D